MRDFLLAFVPIFVAVDAIGVVPVFLSLTEGLDKLQRRRIVLQSFVTALAVAVGFIFLGKAVFRLMGVTEYDFMVAGGVLLFVLATVDLVSGVKFARQMPTLGAFPIGTPLIVGPAVLTTSLMLVDVFGLWPTLASVVVNVALGCLVLLERRPSGARLGAGRLAGGVQGGDAHPGRHRRDDGPPGADGILRARRLSAARGKATPR